MGYYFYEACAGKYPPNADFCSNRVKLSPILLTTFVAVCGNRTQNSYILESQPVGQLNV